MCVCVVYPRTSLRTHATRAQDHRSSTNFHLFFFLSFFCEFHTHFFFLFFIRLLFFFYFCFISTCFGFVNVGRNPSCEIWRKNPNSRLYARRDAKVLQLREMFRRVSHEINDRSLLTSIDEIFFFPGLFWTDNKSTVFPY